MRKRLGVLFLICLMVATMIIPSFSLTNTVDVNNLEEMKLHGVVGSYNNELSNNCMLQLLMYVETDEALIMKTMTDESVVEEQAIEESAVKEPTAEELTVEDPVVEEPAAEEPTAEKPVVEEPVAEEPAVEESVAEDPTAEEPAAEEPVAEEPVAEESATEVPEVGEMATDGSVMVDLLMEEVIVNDPVDSELPEGWICVAQHATGADGSYAFADFEKGLYRLEVFVDGEWMLVSEYRLVAGQSDYSM